MHSSFYENHIYDDPDFPVIFHVDTLYRDLDDFVMHWHENIELLYFIEGSGVVTCDTTRIDAGAGQLVVVNSGNLHAIYSSSINCRYYCLIIDKVFCENQDFYIGDATFKERIKDNKIGELFQIIAEEMMKLKPYYKVSVKSAIQNLLVHLFRNYTVTESGLTKQKRDKKLEMVKTAISQIRKHYKEDISLDVLCSYLGFSKYYCCHTFKEITGRTIVDYINFLRCSYARKLLSSGKYNVSESAELSGFKNLSYFSLIYKKYMGVSPSAETVRNLPQKRP